MEKNNHKKKTGVDPCLFLSEVDLDNPPVLTPMDFYSYALRFPNATRNEVILDLVTETLGLRV